MPKSLFSIRLKTLTLFLILLLSACIQQPQYSDRHSLLELHNLARTQGVNCPFRLNRKSNYLNWNNDLANIAYAHSLDMQRQQKLSHEDSSKTSLGQRLSQSGYDWQAYAENIAFGVTTDKEVFELWIDSVGHCKNIMNDAYSEMGAAQVAGYWTAIYARPR